jgi:hypothetical protein
VGRILVQSDAEADDAVGDLGRQADEGEASAEQAGRAGGLEQRVGHQRIQERPAVMSSSTPVA